MAAAGPSKVASTPSPVIFTMRPPGLVDGAAADAVVVIEQRRPATVAFGGGPGGGVDDVGEQDRREHALGAHRRAGRADR